jgi:hypothetical protein
VVIASSDMSHFLSYEQCERVDARTLELVTSLDLDRLADALAQDEAQLCGAGPVLSLLALQKLRGGRVARVLAHQNSGDTAGDRDRVVGYGVVAFGDGPDSRPAGAATAPPYTLDAPEQKWLLAYARQVVESWVRTRSLPEAHPPSGRLREPGAAFVTLRKQGELRGCIGHTLPTQPLWECVREVAASAATDDGRFPPVTVPELGSLRYEVSVLTPLEPLPDPTQVEVGKDGLLVEWRGRRGLLLPQVPGEFGWTRDEFLSATCRKAGLPLDCWRQGASFQRFRAIVFGEDAQP